MDKGSILAYFGAIATIVSTLSIIGIYLYKKGKPWIVSYLKKILEANEENAANCVKNTKVTEKMQRDIMVLRTDFHKEVLDLNMKNNKQEIFNGRILKEIRDMKEDIKGNANRITKLELDKERELLQQERKEFLNNKGD